MFYTYILRSISQPEQRYIGSTADLKSRLAKHNAGEVPHTSKFKPWKVEAYFAFETKEKAAAFEPYQQRYFAPLLRQKSLKRAGRKSLEYYCLLSMVYKKQ